MSFNRLHQQGFDGKHHGDEGQSIDQDARDIEQLEGHTDLELKGARLEIARRTYEFCTACLGS
jgi:hypothetical protein